MIVIGFIVRVRKKARLGKVGKQIVGFCCKFFHFRNESGVKTGIKLAVVRHCRVDDKQSVLFKTIARNALNICNLFCAAEIAGVHGVEADFFLLPVFFDCRHIVG